MNNYEIAEFFSLLSKLTDIFGGDGFKSKSYASASFAIENLPVQLSETDPGSRASLKGIGASSAKKIREILDTGKLSVLEELIFSIPPGVIEMLKVKGIGPKKIHSIWKEMELESIGELLYACKENRLKNFKGFGEKTQQTIIDSIDFYLKSKGSFLYAQAIDAAESLLLLLQNAFGKKRVFITGDFARQSTIINALEFVVEENIDAAQEILAGIEGFERKEKTVEELHYRLPSGTTVKIYSAEENFIEKVLETSSSPEFFNHLSENYAVTTPATDERHYFELRNLPHYPAFVREHPATIGQALGDHLTPADIKGLIHCHSTWSDGNDTIEALAIAARELGMEYMAISDHSKTAVYAQGLREEQLIAQHAEIDALNKKLHPFKIFKSIESDILGDGSLDYAPTVLATFDLVIASVHSNLKMPQEKAMSRLLAAIENPYTSILGHMTGRLLLSRPGYPLDHEKIIDACAANHVVIELNANPSRLDMDWRYINYALDKGVLISIDPDAHSVKGIDDIRYGIFSAQKAMLTKEKNLSSFSLNAFEAFLSGRKQLKGI